MQFSKLPMHYRKEVRPAEVDRVARFGVDASTTADGNRSIKANLPNALVDPWLVQLRQGNVFIVGGQTHTLEYNAKASKVRPLTVVLEKGASPFSEYAKYIANLTMGWTCYSFTFTSPLMIQYQCLYLT